jgi:hypothetical protein
MCVVTCVVSAARPARTPYLLSDRSLDVTVRHPKERRANFRCEALQSRKLNVYDYLGRLLIRHSRHQSEVYYAEGSIPWSVRNYHNASKGNEPGSSTASKSHFKDKINLFSGCKSINIHATNNIKTNNQYFDIKPHQ